MTTSGKSHVKIKHGRKIIFPHIFTILYEFTKEQHL
jgi:hypothetical protein